MSSLWLTPYKYFSQKYISVKIIVSRVYERNRSRLTIESSGWGLSMARGHEWINCNHDNSGDKVLDSSHAKDSANKRQNLFFKLFKYRYSCIFATGINFDICYVSSLTMKSYHFQRQKDRKSTTYFQILSRHFLSSTIQLIDKNNLLKLIFTKKRPFHSKFEFLNTQIIHFHF